MKALRSLMKRMKGGIADVESFTDRVYDVGLNKARRKILAFSDSRLMCASVW